MTALECQPRAGQPIFVIHVEILSQPRAQPATGESTGTTGSRVVGNTICFLRLHGFYSTVHFYGVSIYNCPDHAATCSPQDGIMTSQVDDPQDKKTCLKLISLGYARSNRVRLYGQEVQLVSDPFPHREGGIAVEVLQGSESSSRTIKLPLSVLQVAGRTEKKRSA
jgi:hypothetical protein